MNNSSNSNAFKSDNDLRTGELNVKRDEEVFSILGESISYTILKPEK